MSTKFASVTVKLSDGSLVGPSSELRGDPSLGIIMLSTDEAVRHGVLTVSQAHRLKELLQDMQSNAAPVAPTQSLSALSRKCPLDSAQELPRSASKNQQQQPQQQQQEDDRGDLTWEQLEDINRGMTNLYKENRIDEAVQLVRDVQGLDMTNEDGEVDLDFSVLTRNTLWKLHGLISQGQAAAVSSGMGQAAAVSSGMGLYESNIAFGF